MAPSVEVASTPAVPTPAVPSNREFTGCDPTWTREAKLKELDSAVERSDLETQSVKDRFTNLNQRSRLALLSAGLIPDDIPFVSLDRNCWSEFYRAHQSLRDGKEKLAKSAAEGWRTCLAANFPDRLEQARSLFRCFGLPETSDEEASATDSAE